MNELMLRRRALMGREKLLPSAYQLVAWIESSNEQYIDTGVHLTIDTRVELGMQMMANGVAAYSSSFGCNTPVIGYATQGISGKTVYTSFGNKSDIRYTFQENPLKDSIHDIVQNAEGWWLDGTKYIAYSNVSVAENPQRHIYVFARMSTTYGAERFSSERCAYFRIIKSGEPVCNLVPCYRISDGEIGMYDTIQNIFRSNLGTGVFAKGPEVN